MFEWAEFEALRQASGLLYAQRRDTLLHATPGLERRLESYRSGPDWYSSVQADILEGWLSHADLYSRILAELDAVDVPRESASAAGISRIWSAYALKARQEYKESILPLCWEVLLKFGDLWPDWKMVTFLRMTAAVPNATSIEPIIFFMEQSHRSSLLDVAGAVLQVLPATGVKSAVTTHLASAEARAQQDPALDATTQYVRQVWRRVLEKLG